MKLIARLASDREHREECEVETLQDLFLKIRERGECIVHDPSEEWRDYQITIYDDYME